MSFYMVCIINFFMFFTYKRRVESNISVMYYENLRDWLPSSKIIYVMGIILCFFQSVKTIFFLVLNVKLIIRRDWADLTEQRQIKIIMSQELTADYAKIQQIKDNANLLELTREEKRKLIFLRGPYFKLFMKNGDESGFPVFEDYMLQLDYYTQCAIFVLSDGDVKQILLIWFCNIMALIL